MKKSLLLLLLMFIFLIGCKKEKVQPVEAPQKTESIDQKQIDSVETGKAEVEKPVVTKEVKKKKAKQGLFFLEDLEGKYPTEEKIFQNKVLKKRLKNMKRLNYDLLVQNWNTETPITIENHIVHSSGCKSHSCPESAFDLFIDLKHNNINVYHFSNNTLRVYTEKGFIELPPDFAEEMEIKKENAKIGSTSDDIESKYDVNLKSSKK